MVEETNTLVQRDYGRSQITSFRRSFRSVSGPVTWVVGICAIGLLTGMLGCAQGPNGGWRPLFPRAAAPAATPPVGTSPDPATPSLSSNAPARGRFGALFGDLRRRADAQSRLAQEQEQRLKDLTDLEREIERERLAFKQKRDEREKQNEERKLLAERAIQQQNSQVDQFKQRSQSLDSDNRDLQGVLAGSQQEIRRLQSEMEMMRGQLNQAARQLTDTDRARLMSEQRVQALQASSERRNTGKFSANNSLRRTLTAVQVPGMDIRQDGDLVRITLQSDKIFLPGTAGLHQGASAYFDQAASVISKNYPNQIVGVESHFDNSSLGQSEWRNSHHLTSAQAMAVFEQLAYRHGINSRQLFVLGHGSNHPLASNETELGRARNRRVEIVIYPERPE